MSHSNSLESPSDSPRFARGLCRSSHDHSADADRSQKGLIGVGLYRPRSRSPEVERNGISLLERPGWRPISKFARFER